jgi:hypothetical protein
MAAVPAEAADAEPRGHFCISSDSLGRSPVEKPADSAVGERSSELTMDRAGARLRE